MPAHTSHAHLRRRSLWHWMEYGQLCAAGKRRDMWLCMCVYGLTLGRTQCLPPPNYVPFSMIIFRDREREREASWNVFGSRAWLSRSFYTPTQKRVWNTEMYYWCLPDNLPHTRSTQRTYHTHCLQDTSISNISSRNIARIDREYIPKLYTKACYICARFYGSMEFAWIAKNPLCSAVTPDVPFAI